MTPRRRQLFALGASLLGTILAVAVALTLLQLGVVRWSVYEEWLVARGRAPGRSAGPRVLVIGDSFLHRWPFAGCLNKSLSLYLEGEGASVTVIGTPGAGPVDYLDRVAHFLPRLHPDLVLLFYNTGNDLTDALYRPDRRPLPMDTVPPQQEFPWGQMMQAGISRGYIESAMRTVEDPRRTGDDVVNPHLLATALDTPEAFRENLLLDSPESRMVWQQVTGMLRQLHRQVKAAGAELFLVALPSVARMGPEHLRFLREIGFEVRPEMLTTTRAQDLLGAFCKEEGIPRLDLLGPLLALPEPERLFFRLDDHFSPRGHQAAFDLVKERLLEPWLARRRAGR